MKTEYLNLAVDPATSASTVPAVSFARTYTGRVTARIHNHRKNQPVTVPISVSINDKEAGRKTVMVAANGTTLAEFTGFDLPIGFSKGRVRIEADDPLKLDNDFLFALGRREKLSVLVVDAGRARQSFAAARNASSPDLPMP